MSNGEEGIILPFKEKLRLGFWEGEGDEEVIYNS